MEEKGLNAFETFEEFPDKYLIVENNTNCYYIKTKKEDFVATRKIDSATMENTDGLDSIVFLESYYSIIDGSLVLKNKRVYSLDKKLISNIEFEITPLSRILNIKGNSKYYLSLEDVKELINFKEEDPKKYSKTRREFYF